MDKLSYPKHVGSGEGFVSKPLSWLHISVRVCWCSEGNWHWHNFCFHFRNFNVLEPLFGDFNAWWAKKGTFCSFKANNMPKIELKYTQNEPQSDPNTNPKVTPQRIRNESQWSPTRLPNGPSNCPCLTVYLSCYPTLWWWSCLCSSSEYGVSTTKV